MIQHQNYIRTAKIVLPIMGVFSLLLVMYISNATHQQTVSNNVQSARSTIEQYRLLRQYYTANVVTKAIKTGAVDASYKHQGKATTIPLPATMIHDLSDLLAKESDGTKLKLYSPYPFPNRVNRQLDDFAKKALKAIKDKPNEIYIETDLTPGNERVRVAIADKLVAQACVDCHNNHPDTPRKNWSLNDTRGVLEASVPITMSLIGNKQMIHTTIAICVVAVLVFTWLLSLGLDKFFIRHLRVGSEQLKTVTIELGATANQLTSNSHTQSTAITELSATAEELVATARQIANNTQQVADSAKQSSASAQSGGQAINEAQKGMVVTKEQVQLIARHMLELGNKSQQIGVVLDIINELSEQTNILSLNATIEAAGAGESGKRFAVVADEVRKLSERAVESTREIHSLITDIQQTANTTIMVTEDGTKAVDEAVRLFTDVSGALSEMLLLVDNTTQTSREIEMTTRQQTTSVQQLSEALNEINNTARQNSSSAEQTLQTVRMLMESSEQFEKLIRGS